MESVEKALYNAALALLAQRDYSEHQLKQKLVQKSSSLKVGSQSFSSVDAPAAQDDLIEILERVISRVKTLNYLSDSRYTESVIRLKSRQGKGPQYIRQFLRQKGISSEEIDGALEGVSSSWFESAYDTYVKKFGFDAAGQDQKLKAKQTRFLLSRGYNYEHIAWVFDRLKCSID